MGGGFLQMTTPFVPTNTSFNPLNLIEDVKDEPNEASIQKRLSTEKLSPPDPFPPYDRQVPRVNLIDDLKLRLTAMPKIETAFTTQSVVIDPIFIAGNVQLLDAKQKYGWSGDGSSGNPIVISGYSITKNATHSTPIHIQDTNLYVRIVQNTIHDGILNGVTLDNVTNIVIDSNTFTSNADYGIYMVDSSNVNITRNTFYDSKLSNMHLAGVTYVVVSSNLLNSTALSGDTSSAYNSDIHIQGSGTSDSKYVTIYNNTSIKSNSVRGINIDTNVIHSMVIGNFMMNGTQTVSSGRITLTAGNANITVANNTLSNNFGNGVYFDYSTNKDISRNTIHNNSISFHSGEGIYIERGSYAGDNNIWNITMNNIFNNTKNGIYIYEGNITGSYIVENTVANNTLTGIRLRGYQTVYTTERYVVNSNRAYNNSEYGIYMEFVDGINVTENIVADNKKDGIKLYTSSYNYFQENLVDENLQNGIAVAGTSPYSKFNVFNMDNIFGNGKHGLDAGFAAQNLTIRKMVSQGNNERGISITNNGGNVLELANVQHSGTYGIYISGVSDLIINESFVASSPTGIYVYYSAKVRIINSQIQDISDKGLHIYASYTKNEFTKGVVSNATYGVYIDESFYQNISSSLFSDGNSYLYVRKSNYTTVRHNVFKTDDFDSKAFSGIELFGSSHSDIFNNSFSFVSKGIVLNGDSSNINYDNTILSNVIQMAMIGISVNYTLTTIIWGNNVTDAEKIAIEVVESNNPQLFDNIIEDTSPKLDAFGVVIKNSFDVQIRDGIIKDVAVGISVIDTTASSLLAAVDSISGAQAMSGGIIENNTILNMQLGIRLESIHNWEVTGNDIQSGNGYGLIGIGIESVTIQNNLLHANAQGGMLFNGTTAKPSKSNTIQNNTIYAHGFVLAIEFHSTSSSNLVTNNIFADNGVRLSSQIKDDGTFNSITKNFFDDAVALNQDANADGYGDQAYEILGAANSKDSSPLLEPPKFSYKSHFVVRSTPLGLPPISPLSGVYKLAWRYAFDSNYHEIMYTIQYSKDNGNTWIELIKTTDLTYDWNVSSLPDGNEYHIKIIASDLQGFSAESTTGPFSIQNGNGGSTTPPGVHTLSSPTIKTPNGGESLSGTVSVTWTASTDSLNHPVTYSLYYSSDNSTWKLIASKVSGTSYMWNTTTVSNGSYYLRIVADDGNGLTADDYSDDKFTIANTVSTTTTSSTTEDDGSIALYAVFPALAVARFAKRRKGYKIKVMNWLG